MKKAFLSPLCSAFLIPGFGQVLNHHLRKGLILLLITMALFISFIVKIYAILKIAIDNPRTYPLDAQGIIKAFKVSQPLSLYVIVGIFLMVWAYSVLDALVYGIKEDKKDKDSKDEGISH